ncbi:MAG: hypothetical protein M3Y40_03010, partial [Chloroflexota bacterium]|nr:hypothetical protein [Chloroflexota bacterium]
MTTADATAEVVARTAVPRLETGGEVEVKQSGIGLVRAETVTVNQAALGAVLARGDISVAQGGGRAFLAGGDLQIQQGGGGMFVAGGDAEIHQGGVGTLVALGGARFEQGGALLALTKDVQAGSGSTIGIAIAPRMTMAAGARVVAGPREVVVAGAVAGAVAGLLMALVRRISRG